MGMRKLKSLYSLLNPQSLKYFSLTQQKILLLLALILLGILYFKFYYHPLLSPSEEIVKEMVIEVLGEVWNPGVYLFKNPPTLKEAIERAGGLKEPAIIEMASSSEILETGTLLTISTPLPPGERENGPLLKGEHGRIEQEEIKIKISRMEANKLLVFSIPLDLNRVSMEDLCLIPGIGESLAQEMIAYRERRRGFRSVEELKNVKGIGEKKYQSLKTFFIVIH
jgi:competence protein ComEA